MCGTPLHGAGVAREARKNVTMLFIDIVGSTALAEWLDPEPLRLLLDRYFAACVTAITEHGGAVEKFIGDAVLAVFGVQVAHEDDAVRAVRAAAQALASLDALNDAVAGSHAVALEARCGVASGEVVAITSPGGDFRVVGDAVNTAARLQSSAQPGEILIGEHTAALVRGHVGIEPVPPLRLKGKAEAVPAWRVIDAVLDEDDSTLPGVALVGRDDELDVLQRNFRRVVQRDQLCMVTVLGPPGIGKTRLVREFLAGLDDDAATVLSGRCSPYGKGITYAPMASMFGALPGGWPEGAGLVGADSPTGVRAVSVLATIMGEPVPADGVGASSSGDQAGVEEISWAARHVLETLGRTRPVIMVWDDLHWAEEALLDLIDDAATWIIDTPVLLLCLARTELLEQRPTWGGGKPCATTLEVGSLTHEQSAALVTELAARGDVLAHDDQDVYRRIATECDGNPLFVELMLAVATTTAAARIPPTVHALLSARLDQLPDAERQLLEMAAVIGRDFTADMLLAMTEDEGAAADEPLTGLVRRRVVQRVAGGYRFRQSLLRDTAYALTPKARRERRHMFLAERLHAAAQAGSATSATDAALMFAFHVESACALRRDLFPGETAVPALASDAADVLIAEGERALHRKDHSAAVGLLERGLVLIGNAGERRTRLVLHLCDSWLALSDSGRAMALLDAETDVPGTDRPALVTYAVQRCIVALRLGLAPPESVAADARRIAQDVAGVDSEVGGDLGSCRYHQLLAYLQLADEGAEAADSSLRRALFHARAMEDRFEEDRLLCAICEVAQWTAAPLDDGLLLCDTLSDRFSTNRALLVPVLLTRAHLTALAGGLDDARQYLDTARAYANDLHLDVADVAVLEMSGILESLRGGHGQAEMHFRRAAAALRTAPQAPDAAMLDVAVARELFRQGRTAEAEAAVDQLVDGAAVLGRRARIAVTALRGRICSVQARHGEAVAAATRARELSTSVDDPCLAGETLLDLAVVLRAAGHQARAADAAAAALSRFTTKGATLLASRTRDWVASPAREGRPQR